MCVLSVPLGKIWKLSFKGVCYKDIEIKELEKIWLNISSAKQKCQNRKWFLIICNSCGGISIQGKNNVQRHFFKCVCSKCHKGATKSRNALKIVRILTQMVVCLYGRVAFSTHCPLVTFQTHISLAEITLHYSLSFPLNWPE